MLTVSYFLSLFPERQSQLSTSRTARKWLRTKADEWDIFPKKRWPGKAVPVVQEGVQKSQAHPEEAGWRTSYKHKTSIHQLLHPDRATERLCPSSFCLRIPWAVWVKNCQPVHTDVGSKTPNHIFFQLLLCFVGREDTLMFCSLIISHYLTME